MVKYKGFNKKERIIEGFVYTPQTLSGECLQRNMWQGRPCVRHSRRRVYYAYGTSIDTSSKLVQAMAWHQIGNKPLPKPVITQIPALCLNVLIPQGNSSPPSAAYMRQWIGSALVQIMACRLYGAKPSLSKPMLGYWNLDLINKLQWNFNQNTNIFIHKRHLKSSSAKWRQFCPGLGGGLGLGCRVWVGVGVEVVGGVGFKTSLCSQRVSYLMLHVRSSESLVMTTK